MELDFKIDDVEREEAGKLNLYIYIYFYKN